MNSCFMKNLLVLSLFICIAYCYNSKAEIKVGYGDVKTDTISFDLRWGTDKDKILITQDIDLKGAAYKLPPQKILEFKGGKIKNGTIIGNQTMLKCSGKVFDRVQIKGTWNVPEISTSMFTDLSYDNALKDVLALAHSKVQNTIVIEKGDYYVTAHKNADVCLTVPSNSTLIIQGSIRLRPHAFPRCDIVRAKGNNIIISGNGNIIGDKHTHLGTDGEWGMGIRFHGATNSSVRGLTIKDCWGDCIYVGGNSKNVTIENCWLDHGRRQGISVTKADSITIKNCKILNVNGTNPQFAIDLEPNANDTVNHILIENVEVVDCEGGVLAVVGKRNAEKKKIGQVTVRNCKLSAISRWPLRMKRCEHVSIENCTINATNEKAAIYSSDIYNLVVKGNTINIEKSMAFTLKNTAKKIVGKNVQQPIETIRVRQQDIRNNRIVEH